MSMEYGQESTGIFNDILQAPHFVNIALSPVSTAPREGALAFDETTQQLYYSRAFKWVPIASSAAGLVLPPGFVVQTTSPTGSTFVARTITSGNASITITNGNGVAGNPVITFNGETFPQGLLSEQTAPSGTV